MFLDFGDKRGYRGGSLVERIGGWVWLVGRADKIARRICAALVGVRKRERSLIFAMMQVLIEGVQRLGVGGQRG